MLTFLRRLCRDQSGTSAIEYGLILAMIVLAMMVALNNFSNESIAMWDNIRDRSTEAVDKAR